MYLRKSKILGFIRLTNLYLLCVLHLAIVYLKLLGSHTGGFGREQRSLVLDIWYTHLKIALASKIFAEIQVCSMVLRVILRNQFTWHRNYDLNSRALTYRLICRTPIEIICLELSVAAPGTSAMTCQLVAINLKGCHGFAAFELELISVIEELLYWGRFADAWGRDRACLVDVEVWPTGRSRLFLISVAIGIKLTTCALFGWLEALAFNFKWFLFFVIQLIWVHFIVHERIVEKDYFSFSIDNFFCFKIGVLFRKKIDRV